MTTTGSPSALHTRPAELLQHLLRFDTTNPPGNERECVYYIHNLLYAAGFDTEIVGLDDSRPNLVTRLKGRGDAPGLLMQGHVDVVTTYGQNWQHPPFGGDLIDGYIWGRGALDMKSGVAMMVAALLRAKAEGLQPPGDVVLAVLADEEAGSDYGARYLVQHHPYLFDGVKYAIGEVGGSTEYIGGRKFYPIQIGEKQMCWMRAVLRGPGGHASLPTRGGAMAKLGRMLARLDNNRLPVHITPPVRQSIEAIAAALDPEMGRMVLGLLDPTKTDAVLDQLGGLGKEQRDVARSLDAVLHNTANATIVHGGEKTNVIPSEIVVDFDGRLLPGYKPEEMLSELEALLGDEVELEVVRFTAFEKPIDMSLYDTLADIMREMDPEGVPVPYVLTGVTDAVNFAKLDIQSYGFTPMKLPQGFHYLETIHAADERIPVEAMDFGTEAIYKLLSRMGGSNA
ncbi:MAG TPA: M20/M25/M40 family metallo-hydrolase [Chloroflexia bacterium]|jgi:acetylornithine deacetylase/succinyl-diaminopimelate desuccinylase-like protein